MPTLYCPTPGCGSATDYEGSKPTVCPKCHKPYSAPFVPAIVPAPEQQQTRIASASAKPKRTNLIKRDKPSRFSDTPATASTIMNLPEDMSPEDLQVPDNTIEEDDESITKEEISSYAEELKASIDTDSIHVDLGEEPVKFSWHGPKI